MRISAYDLLSLISLLESSLHSRSAVHTALFGPEYDISHCSDTQLLRSLASTYSQLALVAADSNLLISEVSVVLEPYTEVEA